MKEIEIEQINNYMQENQRLISENAKLNTQLAEYQAQLNSFSKINLNKFMNNNNLNNFSNNNGNIRDAFVNALSELKKKDQIILDLQNKIKENINNIDNNYDFTNSKINNN